MQLILFITWALFVRVLKKSLEYAQQFNIELSIEGLKISGYGKNKMIYLLYEMGQG